jgi:hypothetical protein
LKSPPAVGGAVLEDRHGHQAQESCGVLSAFAPDGDFLQRRMVLQIWFHDSHWQPKLVAVDEEPDHNIVHLDGF